MKKIIQYLALLMPILLLNNISAQSYHTITIDGTKDAWTSDETFTDISHDGYSGTATKEAYLTWDADYIYFAIQDDEADYGNLATYMYFDVDPETTNGSLAGYTWSSDMIIPFTADYVVVWKNQVDGDYIEVRHYEGGGWTQVASATSASLNSGEYVVDFAIGTDYREVRVKRTTIGSPSMIKYASFTEQQWDGDGGTSGIQKWRYFAFPNESWTDHFDTGAGNTISHYRGYTLLDGYAPNHANSYDYVMRKNYSYLSFDGNDDYVQYTDDATLGLMDGATDYTIEAWVYPIDGTVAEYDYFINRFYSFGLAMYDGNNDGNVEDWYFRISDDGGSTWTYYNTEGDATLTLDAWNHIAVINNSADNTLKLFVNGTDVTTTGGYSAQSMQASVSSDNLYVGSKKATSPNNSFGGYIDEVRLKNVAVNATDLHSSINNNAYYSDANTAGLFHFDEGTGTTTVNVPSGTDATLNNGPVWGTDVSALPLPVELTSFYANQADGQIVLNWETATEVDNYGFEIERASSRLVGTTPRQGEWTTIGFVQGHGNSNSPKSYSFVDDEAISGTVV
ncbi:MAG: LamG domain-containing protein, partial [Chlorobi bacterium]|nr:LamG domain-containing protein [Chlorobiota bacterium]